MSGESAGASPPDQTRNFRDRLPDVLLWLATFALLWPSIRWLASRVMEYEQLGHAILILTFAGIVLVRVRTERIRWVFELHKSCKIALAAGYVFLALAFVLHLPVLVFPALCCMVAAFLQYLLGADVLRLSWALVLAFAMFIVLSLVISMFDWPLRAGAARTSGWLLNLVGQEVELGLIMQGEPKLILAVNEQLFEVAPECNGFGLLSGSLLLSILLVAYLRIRWFDKLLAVGVSLLAAYFINAIRILIICLLAPHVGDRYMLMHEIVGITTMIGGLFLVWWLIVGLPTSSGKAPVRASL